MRPTVDEIVSRAQELLGFYTRAMNEWLEADATYKAALPPILALGPSPKVEPWVPDWEEGERRARVLEEKRATKDEALREYWEFREQYGQHLKRQGFLQ